MNRFSWFCVAGTIFLTICGQLLIKWRLAGLSLPAPLGGKLVILIRQLGDPWVILAFAAAFAASLFWMSAMTRLPLSVAYPFMSLSFVLTTLFGVAFLGEPLSLWKLAGILLVAIGLALIARS